MSDELRKQPNEKGIESTYQSLERPHLRLRIALCVFRPLASEFLEGQARFRAACVNTVLALLAYKLSPETMATLMLRLRT